MLRYAVKHYISKHAQSWDLRVDFFKSDVFMKTQFFFFAQICDFQKCEKVIISLLSVEFHLKVTASDESSKIQNRAESNEITQFSSCSTTLCAPRY